MKSAASALLLAITLLSFSASANGEILNCSSCADCSSLINSSAAGGTVQLTANIMNYNGTCIRFNGKDSIIFDCLGKRIDGKDLGTGYGIDVSAKANNNMIRNCLVTDFFDGVRVSGSLNNSFIDVASNSNKEHGFLIHNSNGSSFSNITAISNSGAGMQIRESQRNTVTNLTARNNGGSGVEFLGNSGQNYITGSTITNNTGYGILLQHQGNGTANQCPRYNRICNNFFNNTANVGSSSNSNRNYWNATRTAGPNIAGGDFIGGNCWSNPSGKGFSQTCNDSDNDGICDYTYKLSANNVDYLPILCAPRLSQLKITVSTIKETYPINEQINLTDPPDDSSLQPDKAVINIPAEKAKMPALVSSAFSVLPQVEQERIATELIRIRKGIEEKNALWRADYNPILLESDRSKKKLLGLKPPSSEETLKSKSILTARQKRLAKTQRTLGLQAAGLPDSFDWRNVHGRDYMTPVRNQGSCGSCWAFASVAVLEGSINAYYNNPNIDADLSEQDLVSCFHGKGCDGAYSYQIEDIFRTYYKTSGLTSEACFPYTAGNSNCSNRCAAWQSSAWKTAGYIEPDLSGIENIKRALIENGPLEVGMTIYSDFYSYSGGIYHHTTDDCEGFHAVTIVGYGIYDGMDYWIVKNSWGKYWGEGGYFRILAGDSDIDSRYAYGALKPSYVNSTMHARICEDNDKDGYCNWGLGQKPSACPSCSAIMDCNDSNPGIYQGCGSSTEPTGVLLITTNPDGADVFVKDQGTGKFIYRGRTTGNTLAISLAIGVREIKVSKTNYVDYAGKVSVTQSGATLNVTLSDAPILSHPLNNDIFRAGDLIEIRGSVPGGNLSGYAVHYGKGENPANWSANGINLTNGGLYPVNNGMLATWDTSSLTSKGDFYTVRLTVYTSAGAKAYYIKNVYLDPSLKKGWPKRIMHEEAPDFATTASHFTLLPLALDGNQGSSPSVLEREELLGLIKEDPAGTSYYWAGHLEPVAADINKDGYKEIIIYKGGAPPRIQVYNHDGSLLWSRNVSSQAAAGGNLHILPVGDMDNDEYSEIIAFNPMLTDPFSSELVAYNRKGSVLWSASISKDYHPAIIMADLNLDGKKEIIVKGNDAENETMTVVDSSGKILSWWHLPNSNWGASIVSSPAVGNFDSDPELEIVSAGPSEYAGGWNNTGVIYVYNMDGSVVKGWPVYTDGIIFSSPVVGDINRDGSQEIVVGTMFSYDETDKKIGGGIYAFDRSGKVLPGWPYKKGYDFWSTPSLSDIDGDGDLEIAASRTGFEAYLLHHTGKPAGGWPQVTAWNSYYSMIMGDVNNDNKIDIITTAGNGFSPSLSSHGGVYAWNANGTLIKGFPKMTEADAEAPAAIDDIDNDGKLEMVASSDYDYDKTSKTDKNRGTVYVWELDSACSKEAEPWPTYMHDPQHTGCYDCAFTAPIKSMINNTGPISAKGTLLLKIQKSANGTWQNYRTVVSKTATVPAHGHLALDTIWNPYNVRINQSGTYRVYASFKTPAGQIQATDNFYVA